MYTRCPSIANVFQKAILLRGTKCNKINQRHLRTDALVKFSKIENRLRPTKRCFSGGPNSRNSRHVQGVGVIKKSLPKFPREMVQPMLMTRERGPNKFPNNPVTPALDQSINENAPKSGTITIVIDKDDILKNSSPNEDVQIHVTTTPDSGAAKSKQLMKALAEAEISEVCSTKCNCCPQCEAMKRSKAPNIVAIRPNLPPFSLPSNAANVLNNFPGPFRNFTEFSDSRPMEPLNVKRSRSMSDFAMNRKPVQMQPPVLQFPGKMRAMPVRQTSSQSRLHMNMHSPPVIDARMYRNAPAFQQTAGPNIQMRRRLSFHSQPEQQPIPLGFPLPKPKQEPAHDDNVLRPDLQTKPKLVNVLANAADKKQTDEFFKLIRKYSSFSHNVVHDNLPSNQPGVKQRKEQPEEGRKGPESRVDKPEIHKSKGIVERVLRPASFSADNGNRNAIGDIGYTRKMRLHGAVNQPHRTFPPPFARKPSIVNLEGRSTKNRFLAERVGAPRLLMVPRENVTPVQRGRTNNTIPLRSPANVSLRSNSNPPPSMNRRQRNVSSASQAMMAVPSGIRAQRSSAIQSQNRYDRTRTGNVLSFRSSMPPPHPVALKQRSTTILPGHVPVPRNIQQNSEATKLPGIPKRTTNIPQRARTDNSIPLRPSGPRSSISLRSNSMPPPSVLQRQRSGPSTVTMTQNVRRNDPSQASLLRNISGSESKFGHKNFQPPRLSLQPKSNARPSPPQRRPSPAQPKPPQFLLKKKRLVRPSMQREMKRQPLQRQRNSLIPIPQRNAATKRNAPPKEKATRPITQASMIPVRRNNSQQQPLPPREFSRPQKIPIVPYDQLIQRPGAPQIQLQPSIGLNENGKRIQVQRMNEGQLQSSLPASVTNQPNQLGKGIEIPKQLQIVERANLGQTILNPIQLQKIPQIEPGSLPPKRISLSDKQQIIATKGPKSVDTSVLAMNNPAVLFYAPGKLKLVNVPVPRLSDEKGIVVKMLYVHLTDSDSNMLASTQDGPYKLTQPTVAGKSGSGVVVDVGKAVENIKIGDKVCVKGMSCGKCTACENGNELMCERVSATDKLGILKRYHAVPAKFVIKLPDAVHPIDGAMMDELSSSIRACQKSSVTAGDSVLILGGKSLGLWTALAAKSMGATNVCLADSRPSVLDQAKKVGVDRVYMINPDWSVAKTTKHIVQSMEGESPRIVFDCKGSPLSNGIAINTSQIGGKVVLMKNALSNQPIFLSDAVERGIDILSSQHGNNDSERAALQFLSSGKLQLKGIDTALFDIANVYDAFGLLNSGTNSNIFIQPSRLDDASDGKKKAKTL